MFLYSTWENSTHSARHYRTWERWTLYWCCRSFHLGDKIVPFQGSSGGMVLIASPGLAVGRDLLMWWGDRILVMPRTAEVKNLVLNVKIWRGQTNMYSENCLIFILKDFNLICCKKLHHIKLKNSLRNILWFFCSDVIQPDQWHWKVLKY